MTTKEAIKLLLLPPVEWREKVESLSKPDQWQLAVLLDDISTRAAFLATYVDERIINIPHDRSVSKANRQSNKVRKVLGFSEKHNIRV